MNFKSFRNYFLIVVFLFAIQNWFLPISHANTNRQKPASVVIVPIDGRNQTYDYVERIVKICGYEPIMPPRKIMGNISSPVDAYKKQWNIWYWLNHALNDDVELLILSSDALIYGGLFESRHSSINLQRAYNNLKLIEIIREKYPQLKIHVFSSIPRKDAQFRDRNQLINRRLLQYVENNIIDLLSISGDDVTDIGNQVLDIAQLKKDAAKLQIDHRLIISDVDRIRLGIDESAMVLFIRYLNSKREMPFKVYIEFREITSARITNDQYSATPVMSVALDMIKAAGAKPVFDIEEADLVLAANHHSTKVSMDDYLDRIEEILSIKPVTIGDFSSREQQAVFFEKLYKRGLFEKLAGYANWGMGTNTTGTAICQGIASLLCPGENSCQEKGAFLYERLITDYIYLNKIHLQMAGELGIPAYSRHRMSAVQAEEAAKFTNRSIAQVLSNLGVSFEKIEADEVFQDEMHEKHNSGQFNDIKYIPLSFEETKTPETEQILFRFNAYVWIKGEKRIAEITAGPVSFPFHRLFEIRIPVTSKLQY